MNKILAAVIILAALSVPAVRAAYVTDTNSTTSVTTVAPKGPNTTLFGKTGGTNTVWVNYDGTTNGWIKVSN